jgi:hypothetical protein
VRRDALRSVWPTGRSDHEDAEDTETRRPGPESIGLGERRLSSVVSDLMRKPMVSSLGIRPRYDATLDAFGNRSTWSIAATNRAAMTGPTPETVIKRCIRSSSRARSSSDQEAGLAGARISLSSHRLLRCSGARQLDRCDSIELKRPAPPRLRIGERDGQITASVEAHPTGRCQTVALTTSM